jgi:hypothetical protein
MHPLGKASGRDRLPLIVHTVLHDKWGAAVQSEACDGLIYRSRGASTANRSHRRRGDVLKGAVIEHVRFLLAGEMFAKIKRSKGSLDDVDELLHQRSRPDAFA